MTELGIARAFHALFDPKHEGYSKVFKTFKGGRGGAKTTHIAQAFIVRGMGSKRKILCGREYQNSITDSVHATLKEEIEKMPAAEKHYTVQETGIYGKNGTEFLFKGLHKSINSVKSIPGITDTWIEEGQTISQRSLDILIPTVLRTADPWVVTSFNPDDEDDAVYKRFVTNFDPNTDYLRHVNFDENPWFPEALRVEMERAQRTDTDLYNHVWLGETRKNGLGTIYSRLMGEARADGRICGVPYNPAFPVITAWDLGFGDSTVIWFCQIVGKEVRIIDSYGANLEALDHYVKLVKSKPYNYEMHVFPHDAGHASLRTGTTLVTQLEQMGLGKKGKDIEVLPPDSVESGIQLMRSLLPQMWIDEKKNPMLIKAMEKYQYEFDEDNKRFSNKPLHNWCSDWTDAGRELAVYLARRKSPPVAQTTQPSYSNLQPGSWMG